MSDRLIEITARSSSMEGLCKALEGRNLRQMRVLPEIGGRRTLRALIARHERQDVLDTAQDALEGEDDWELLLYPLEASLPREDARQMRRKRTWFMPADSREEIYEDAMAAARIDPLFIAIAVLSTIVVSVGLVTDSVAVVIGGMVIAPMLGPNLALALSIALGDRDMLFHAVVSNGVGFGIALLMSLGVGYFGTVPVDAAELVTRTDVGTAGIVLALASGVAAALSLATGLSGTLVGVMVAVALVPPACIMGMMLGAGRLDEAYGAGLLLAVNLACIHIAAHAVFFLQGLRPRGWVDVNTAHQSVVTATAAWLVLLALLVVAMVIRHA